MANSGTVSVSGERKQWHKITLDFDGPQRGEDAGTFLNHRLDVTFTHKATGKAVTVPGYFAADGDAADSNASSGSTWRAHFNPSETGAWTWEASFRKGANVAVSANLKAGASGGAMDGKTGTITVGRTDKTGDDLRAKGMIEYDGDQYLNHAGTGEVFLKSGVGSPENFLAYSGFDNTPDNHHYRAHERHFDAGDPTWDGGKGKGILGAVNYLADQGVNSAYMMLMNVGGDGQDVWPWSATDLHAIRKNVATRPGSFDLEAEARSFDVSKLDQWERVFSHMEEKGIALHLFLQETENDYLLNDGDVGTERALFMREMVARFGHHNGVIWNLGEENTNSAGEIRAHSKALKAVDPYDHPVALHTYPGEHDRYERHDGEETLDVLSFQTANDQQVPDLDRFLGAYEKAGRPAVAFLDEPGSGSIGINAEGDPGWQGNHDNLREVLWTFYMEGGSGAEWYFGYNTAGGTGGDLRAEDFTTRETVYAWAKHARDFFEAMPLEDMAEADRLVSRGEALAEIGETYAIFLPDGGTTTLDLGGQSGRFDVSWFDPLTGAFHDGTVRTVSGGGAVSLGKAPYAAGREWAVLVEAAGGTTAVSPPKGEPPVVLPPIVVDPPAPQPKGDPVYQMQKGLVVMQAEDGVFHKPGASGNATWDERTRLDGYKGDGYLVFDSTNDYFASSNAGKDHTGPIKYTFRVDGDASDVKGTYYISLRAMKPATGEPHDRNNDFFVATGDADEAPTGWKKLYFGGGANKWLWGHTFDHNHKKSPAKMIIDGPGEYSIWIAGRSRKAGVDEIHIQKGSRSTDPYAKTSPLVDGDRPADPPKPPEPPKPPVDAGDDFAINLGSKTAHKAADGTVFAADTTGVGNPGKVSAAIGDTTDDALYRAYAWDGKGLDYGFDVENGTYRVTMHFAETHAPNFKKGGLVFDVKLEDKVAVNDLDVFAKVGARNALEVTRTVLVTDGTLDVEARKMAAIEVERITDVPDPQGDTVLAIAMGSGTAVKAKDGTVFAADDTGIGRVSSSGAAIAGTVDDALYRRGVWSKEGLSYDFALEDGTYTVAMHFAELWSGAFADGVRVFDVKMEGRRVVDDLDVHAEVGRNRALVVEREVTVTDGTLDLDLVKGVQNPILNALEIVRTGEAGGGSGSGGDSGSGGAKVVARDDMIAVDWSDLHVEDGVARIALTAADLLGNDTGRDLQLDVTQKTAEAEMRIAGESTVIDLLVDAASFDGRLEFGYRAHSGDVWSEQATVTVAVNGMPGADAASLSLVDAGADRVLFELGEHTVVERASVQGRSLTVSAEAEIGGVQSAKLFVDGAFARSENVAPYTLFGDKDGDFYGGFSIGAGKTVDVRLHAAKYGRGAVVGEESARVVTDTGVITGRAGSADVFAFDETRMGADEIKGFDAFDRLAFFGGKVDSAAEVLSRAETKGGDTVIDFGGGDVLTLDGFTGLGADHFAF